jgi:hypothetical protein
VIQRGARLKRRKNKREKNKEERHMPISKQHTPAEVRKGMECYLSIYLTLSNLTFGGFYSTFIEPEGEK